MITRVSIQNFKRLTRLEVDGLSGINLITGRNNVGKSTLLEALFLLLNSYSPQAIPHHLGFRGAFNVTLDADTAFLSASSDWDPDRVIRIEADGIRDETRAVEFEFERGLRGHTVDLQLIRQRETGTAGSDASPTIRTMDVRYFGRHGEIINRGKSLIGQGTFKLELEKDREPLPKAYFVGMRSMALQVDLAKHFSKLDLEFKADLLVSAIRSVHADVTRVDIQQIGETPVLHVTLDKRRKQPIFLLGDGVVRIVGIVLGMVEARDGVLMVDEIDSGFHHSVLPQVWRAIGKAANDLNCQVFATTHSDECIRAAVDAELTDLAYFRLQPDGDGVKAVRYDLERLRSAQDLNVEVR